MSSFVREEESPKKNEDEIDLEDSEDEEEATAPEQPPLNPANMKQHLQNLLNKLDGKPKEDPPAEEKVEEEPISDPEMEEISSDEDEDDETPIDFAAALKPPSPPPQVEIMEENIKLLKNSKPIPTIPVYKPKHFTISQRHRRGPLTHFIEPIEIGVIYFNIYRSI